MTANPARADRRRFKRLATLAMIPVLAGGFVTVTAGTAAAEAAPAPAPAPVVPTFVNGLSQAVFSTVASTRINSEVWVVSEVDSDRDGQLDLVHMDITRVAETATEGLKVPVIMELSPYYAGGSDVANWNVDHEIGSPPTSKAPAPAPSVRSTSPTISTTFESTWVPRGFAVVHAEGFGSGLSEGCPTSGGPNESMAGKAVVDWLNGRAVGYTSAARTTTVTADWTTGSVGMIGTSYNGTMPIATATTGVEGLDAIVPISAISDWYDYYRANGAVRAPGGYQGEDLDVLADYVHTRPNLATCQPIIDELRAQEDRATGDKSAFWEERNYLANADKIKAATLIAHGQNDWNVQMKNATALYETLKANNVPHQIYIHQGGHGGSPNDTLLNRWFTKYLYKQDNGVETRPKAYITRENNVLTEYPDYPDAAAARVGLALNSPSVANGQGALGINRAPSTGNEVIIDNTALTVTNLGNAAVSPNRLVYKTKPLTAPVRISGTPTISLNLAVDRPKANLSATLVRYSATGVATAITRGWMDVENRNSVWTTDAITPGTFYQFNFDFQPKDYVFPVGTSIGVVVVSSDRDYTIRPAPGTQLTVNPAKSTLNLPIVGGISALAAGTGPDVPGGQFSLITAQATAGGLNLTTPSTAPVVMGPVNLSGVDQFTPGTLNQVSVADARGIAGTWALTGQVTDFVSGTGTILADNLGWQPSAGALTGSLPTSPGTATVVNPGPVVIAGSGLGSPKTLCSAPQGASSGTAVCGGGLTLGVPGSTLIGNYSALLTLTLI